MRSSQGRRLQKGDAGYIASRRSRYLLFAIILFLIAITLVIIGLNQTGSRMNIFTIAAILLCLPACNQLTEFIAMFPLHSIDPAQYKEIEEKTTHLIVAYDMVLTVEEKLMPVDVIVFYGHVLCGFDTGKNTDEAKVSSYLKEMLADNNYDKMTVKIFSDYKAFLKRVDELEQNSEADGSEIHEREEELKSLVLSCSM